ncbi:hypothetical protein LAUMK13_04561 [Mycobacterium innocens]|uniref:Uncharacterized protein n=1 Tax=Mycobacterium innocens TaxID=2341083 RepID=A0A498QB49_9MYCO|nr:hypothetical protein LAUMK13_04561 [Mycobacterium innocens]
MRPILRCKPRSKLTASVSENPLTVAKSNPAPTNSLAQEHSVKYNTRAQS